MGSHRKRLAPGNGPHFQYAESYFGFDMMLYCISANSPLLLSTCFARVISENPGASIFRCTAPQVLAFFILQVAQEDLHTTTALYSLHGPLRSSSEVPISTVPSSLQSSATMSSSPAKH